MLWERKLEGKLEGKLEIKLEKKRGTKLGTEPGILERPGTEATFDAPAAGQRHS